MKRENLNLILIIIVIMVPLVSFLITTSYARKTISKVTTEAVEQLNESENETANAIGKLVSIPILLTGTLGAMVILLLWGIIVIISFLSLLLAIIARVVIKNKEKKITYRVLMTLVFIPYTALELIWLSFLSTKFSPMTLVYFLCSGICLGISYYLTYSKKMFITDENVQVEDIKEEQIGVVEETNNTENKEENK